MVGLVPEVRGKGDAAADMLRYIWKEVQTDPLPGVNTLSVTMGKRAPSPAGQTGPGPGAPVTPGLGGDHLNILV
jgi:hypothetical protein